ncbi:MAG: hypothetical protein JSU68_07970 [Phycisphaerales bacterium]|nr:MAG: hypothetical protein JSU68_07970 [Phycisphaerales bacterium]
MTFDVDHVVPDRAAVLELQGIPPETGLPDHLEGLYAAALRLLTENAAPAAVLADVSKPRFGTIYQGEGNNEHRTPVADIFPAAERLALFAVTMGPQLERAVRACFDANDFAVGSMLDSVASASTDRAADLVQARFRAQLDRRGLLRSDTGILRYSPGYCGWHISGQRRLFEYLEPEQIGISLRDSYLMQPLKSISGVLIAGPRDIHDIADNYDCCESCDDHGCRERIQSLFAEQAADKTRQSE